MYFAFLNKQNTHYDFSNIIHSNMLYLYKNSESLVMYRYEYTLLVSNEYGIPVQHMHMPASALSKILY